MTITQEELDRYKDAKNVFDAAIVKRGIRVPCDNPANLRGRMHRYRSLYRAVYGRSQYDDFIVRIVEGSLLIELRSEAPVL